MSGGRERFFDEVAMQVNVSDQLSPCCVANLHSGKLISPSPKVDMAAGTCECNLPSTWTATSCRVYAGL